MTRGYYFRADIPVGRFEDIEVEIYDEGDKEVELTITKEDSVAYANLNAAKVDELISALQRAKAKLSHDRL